MLMASMCLLQFQANYHGHQPYQHGDLSVFLFSRHILMVVVVGKEYEVYPSPDHLDQEEMLVFDVGSVSARGKHGMPTSTRRPLVKDISSPHGKLHGTPMAVIKHHCKNHTIIVLS